MDLKHSQPLSTERLTEEVLRLYAVYAAYEREKTMVETALLSAASLEAQTANTTLAAVLASPVPSVHRDMLIRRLASLTARLKLLGDAMQYDTPAVWMNYKREAYRGTPQEIATIADFRTHCSKPGYICTKRFTFLNEYLARTSGMQLTDSAAFPGAADMSTLINHPAVRALEHDETFLQEWSKHEFYIRDGRVAKWEDMAG